MHGEPDRPNSCSKTAIRWTWHRQHSQGVPSVLPDIAEEEMLDEHARWGRGRTLGEVDANLGGRVRYHHQIAAGAEGRLEDRPEGRLHEIGMGQPMPFLRRAVSSLAGNPLPRTCPAMFRCQRKSALRAT
jgi:hypothetical protein